MRRGKDDSKSLKVYVNRINIISEDWLLKLKSYWAEGYLAKVGPILTLLYEEVWEHDRSICCVVSLSRGLASVASRYIASISLSAGAGTGAVLESHTVF